MRLPSRLTVLTAALLVLLPALAVLQYQWVGQLSDAARERMQRNLHNAARQFNESFDGEVARAFVSLQVDSAIVRDQAWARYAERYGAWANTTAYPGLVAGVYLIDSLGTDLRLRRWDPQSSVFADAAWVGPLESARAHFASELAAFGTGERRDVERRPIRANEALLVAPLLDVHIGPRPQARMHLPLVSVFGFTLIHLNMPLIREQLLPALTRRHFSQADGDAYRVAIVDASNPSRAIYKSSPDVSTDPAHADVNMPIFGVHHEPLMFLARGAAGQPALQLRRDLAEAAGAMADGVRERRNLMVSVIRETRDDDVTVRARVSNAGAGQWRLLAQHQRGSLEAAVSGVRQRNLLVSFGILLLMGVSIGLLALSSRRAHRLALQQMEFVAGVSHELRTPVAVIRSAAENLSHGVVGDPDRVRRYGDAIQVEARRLGEMIERVLQFAGIESGRRVLRTPLAIDPLVREAVEAALPGHAGVVVERHVTDGLPPVLGEAAALRSAIQNLVANAVKYGGADRWVGVRAEAAPDRQEVLIVVEDHGQGITAADLPHIFDPFFRGTDATSRRIQGNGLGLALVQRIAEAHGGRVTVATREGAGSAFTLHLPAATAASMAAASCGHLEPMVRSSN